MYSIHLIAFISSKIILYLTLTVVGLFEHNTFFKLDSTLVSHFYFNLVIWDIDVFYLAYDLVIAHFPQPTGIRKSADVNAYALPLTLTFNGHSVVETMKLDTGCFIDLVLQRLLIMIYTLGMKCLR